MRRTIIIDSNENKNICLRIPLEFYKKGTMFAKLSGFKNIQQYVTWLLCRDLIANNLFEDYYNDEEELVEE